MALVFTRVRIWKKSKQFAFCSPVVWHVIWTRPGASGSQVSGRFIFINNGTSDSAWPSFSDNCDRRWLSKKHCFWSCRCWEKRWTPKFKHSHLQHLYSYISHGEELFTVNHCSAELGWSGLRQNNHQPQTQRILSPDLGGTKISEPHVKLC